VGRAPPVGHRSFLLHDLQVATPFSATFDRSLTGQRVVAVLERAAARDGLPKVIQVDNGAEFTSHALDMWAHRHGVKLAFSRPGTPTDNPFIEAFRGVQWTRAGRMPRPGVVLHPRRSQTLRRRMEEGLQHDPTAYRAGQPDTRSPGCGLAGTANKRRNWLT